MFRLGLRVRVLTHSFPRDPVVDVFHTNLISHLANTVFKACAISSDQATLELYSS